MITISCSRLVVVVLGPVEKTIKTIVTGFGWNATSDLRVDRLPERRNHKLEISPSYWSTDSLVHKELSFHVPVSLCGQEERNQPREHL